MLSPLWSVNFSSGSVNLSTLKHEQWAVVQILANFYPRKIRRFHLLSFCLWTHSDADMCCETRQKKGRSELVNQSLLLHCTLHVLRYIMDWLFWQWCLSRVMYVLLPSSCSIRFIEKVLSLSLSFRLCIPQVRGQPRVLLHSARFSACFTLSCKSSMLYLMTSIHLFLCLPLLKRSVAWQKRTSDVGNDNASSPAWKVHITCLLCGRNTKVTCFFCSEHNEE